MYPKYPNRRPTATAQSAMSVLFVFALVTALSCAAPVYGQATHLAPDPISERDLDRYFSRLDLSPDQVQKIEEVYERYREQFRELREGVVQRMIDQQQRLTTVPTRAEWVRRSNQQRSVMRRIAELDDLFFDQVAATLGVESMLNVERLKRLRDRQRYESLIRASPSPLVVIELAEIMNILSLDDDQREHVDFICSEFERQLTRQLREYFDIRRNAEFALLEAVELAGLHERAEQDPTDPDLHEAFAELVQENMQPLIDHAWRIAETTRSAERRLREALDLQTARELRHHVYTRISPDSGTALRFHTGRLADYIIDAALQLPDLSDDDRKIITAAAHDFWRRTDPAIDALTDVALESQLQLSMGGQAAPAPDDRPRRDEIEVAVRDAFDRLIEEIEMVVGEARTRELRLNASMPAMRELSAAVRATRQRQEPRPAPRARRPTQGVAPLDQEELDRLADRLGLDDVQRAVLEHLHGDYLARFERSFADVVLAQILEMRREIGQLFADSVRNERRLSELFDSEHAKCLQIPDLLKEIEGELLTDIELSLVNEEHAMTWHLFRRAREASWYSPANLSRRGPVYAGLFGAPSDSEASINVFGLLAGINLSSDELKAITPIVNEYSRQVFPLLRTKFEAAVDSQRSNRQFDHRMRKSIDAGEGPISPDEEIQFRRQSSRLLIDVQQSLAELNRRMYERLLDTLGDETSNVFRERYHRRAFPTMFADENNLDRLIAEAMGLDGLEEHVREALGQLAEEYEREYGTFTARMLELHLAEVHPVVSPHFRESATAADRRRWSALGQQFERFVFERNEVNIRTARRLRELLNEEQIRRAGGLPQTLE